MILQLKWLHIGLYLDVIYGLGFSGARTS